jgi:hypothetical protein
MTVARPIFLHGPHVPILTSNLFGSPYIIQSLLFFVRDFYENLDSQTVYVRWRYSAGLKFATSVPLEPSKCEKIR